tara:strand:- start:773 stop:1201 length:429 start_codon:yes stop_codon:yes gene_type:complete
MIKYKLFCKNCDLSFDSWFASSKEYEKLKKKKFLSCLKCDSYNIEKSLMSPNIIKNKSKVSMELQSKKFKKIRKRINEYQKFIKKNFEYVGENFSHEARTLHYDKKKKAKGIYGIATKDDLRELSEEGIETEMIPWIEDKNN